MKKLRLTAIGIALAAMAASAAALNLDLRVIPSSGTINGGIFQTPSTTTSGTGLIDPFVRIQQTGSERGYNTSANLSGSNQDLDMKDGIWTHDLQLKDIQTNKVIIGGVSYYQFVLDINESSGGGNSLLSINAIQFYTSSTGAKNVNADANIANIANLGTKVWDMDVGTDGDSRIDLEYDNFPGSGKLDMYAFIPTAVFGTDLNSYIYMYSAYGNPYGSDAGFEEWAHKNQGYFDCVGCSPPPQEIPEPSSLALLGLGLLAAGAMRRRNS